MASYYKSSKSRRSIINNRVRDLKGSEEIVLEFLKTLPLRDGCFYSKKNIKEATLQEFWVYVQNKIDDISKGIIEIPSEEEEEEE